MAKSHCTLVSRDVLLDHATSYWSAVIMLSTCCTLFMTPRWSGHMTEWVPGLSDEDVVSIVVCLDVGAFFAFLPGWCYDAWGCKVVGYVGATLSLAGYLSMFVLVSSGQFANVYVFCVAGFVMGQGASWSSMCALSVVACNFQKEHRGRAVGLLMTAFGLSAGIYSEVLFVAQGAHVEPSMLLYIGIALACISAIATMGLARLPTGMSLSPDSARIAEALACCLVLLGLIISAALARPQLRLAIAGTTSVLYGGVVLFQLLLVGRLMHRWGLRILWSHILPEDQLTPGETYEHVQTSQASEVLEGMSFQEALRTPEFWLLLFVLSGGEGIGITLCNSIATIPSIHPVSGVALFAAGNSLGRFMLGYLSDLLLGFVDLSDCLLLVSAMLCASQWILRCWGHVKVGAYAGIFLASFSFGSYLVLVPAAESEWFGQRHFGKIHGCLVFLAGVGGVLVVFKGTSLLAEWTAGPCNDLARQAACADERWRATSWSTCLGVLLAATVRHVPRGQLPKPLKGGKQLIEFQELSQCLEA
eukprot:CAMPEP_0203902434 /NCGR_PEP_ID=MMETSP0359-20131031/44495_1 /ASSEMBLY_ACC=CAM_ASM_000338 /TAXON_ID=268821 /ORGANISM="Scrippsiella Hangoei, Strain SHTV-5" /LENGTH=530 /DNA_ID=CAMNT_0050826291 /DNA_START=22 /DNA_END=1614 /DNA_ORIENTATION=-